MEAIQHLDPRVVGDVSLSPQTQEASDTPTTAVPSQGKTQGGVTGRDECCKMIDSWFSFVVCFLGISFLLFDYIAVILKVFSVRE